VHIPGQGDHESEVIPISSPKSCRSRFRTDADQEFDLKPITFCQWPER